MALRHLSRLLVCASLQLAIRGVAAGLTKGTANPWDPIMQSTCPVQVRVEDGNDLVYVPLLESQEFLLTPNLPRMSMRVLQDDVLYKLTMDGTMVKLVQCDERETNCTVLEQGGKKDRAYLMPNKPNRILVNYINDEITVDVNGRVNVMRGHMQMTKGFSKGGSGGVDAYVTFTVPPARPAGYSATFQVLCSGAPPQIWTEAPPPPSQTAPITIAPSLPERPYKDCPLYRVEADHPSMPAVLENELTLAVYPSHSALHLIIGNDRQYFKVHVNESTAELLRCQVTGKRCSSMDRSDIDETFINSGKWNIVIISLLQDQITISINDRKEVLVASLQSTYNKLFKVAALAPQAVSVGGQEHFVAFVNVKCEVIEQKMVWPTRAPRKEDLPTMAPIVDVTAGPEPDASGISRTVIIVVAVLVGILLIIALAIIITTVKKRRSAAISETSPLQNREQQQQNY